MERLNPFSTYSALNLRDLWQAARRLLKAPGFTIAATLTFGLGLGATTAIFSVLYAALWASLPYPNAEQLLIVRERQPEFASSSVAYPNYLDVRAEQTTLQGIALFRAETINVSGRGLGGEAESIPGGRVAWDYLRVARVQVQLGRDFAEDDDRPGALRTAIISDRYFGARFNRDPDSVGRTIIANGLPHVIIGVLPAAFDLLGRPDMLVPLGDERAKEGTLSRGNHLGYSMLARMKPAGRERQRGRGDELIERLLGPWAERTPPPQSLARVRADLDRIYERLEKQYPGPNNGVRSSLQPVLEARVGSYRNSLYLLFGATTCVLLIACANVANLCLARGVGRQRELAIRASLGAGRGQLLRELLAEHNVIALLGWGAAFLLTYWTLDLIVLLSPDPALRLEQIRINVPVFVWSSLALALCEVVFGLLPAWQISRSVDLSEALSGSSRGSTASVETQRLRQALVVVQVALALGLLTCAGLLLRSYGKLQGVNLGFEPERLLVLNVALPAERYDTEQKETRFFDEFVRRLGQLPGVTAVATSQMVPFGDRDWSQSYQLTGAPPPPPGRETNMYVSPVTRGYFEAMGMPILRGRNFTDADGASAPVVVIVDEAFVARHFQGRDPIGQQIDATIGTGENRPPMTIVGVVPVTRREYGRLPDFPQVYFHAPQNSTGSRFVVVRVKSGEPLALTQALRRELAAIDPDQPLARLTTMETMMRESLGTRRLVLWLFGVFAALALCLAVVGIYSVMALTVAHRTREMGIRMALGADRRTILDLVLRQGMWLVGLGLALGLVLAVTSGQFMQSFLFGVGTLDPVVLIAVAFVLALTGALACYIPARRATEVDPVEALRAE
ncbi:MAG: ABC transporter permease [Verrucomicrobia bacterium]|nr:ABC transporter permease [Verrucomicrobiota bacterium]